LLPAPRWLSFVPLGGSRRRRCADSSFGDYFTRPGAGSFRKGREKGGGKGKERRSKSHIKLSRHLPYSRRRSGREQSGCCYLNVFESVAKVEPVDGCVLRRRDRRTKRSPPRTDILSGKHRCQSFTNHPYLRCNRGYEINSSMRRHANCHPD
jgi:hypothetical protein